MTIRYALTLAASLALAARLNAADEHADEQANERAAREPAADAHAGHAHAAPPRTVEDVKAARCEHDIPMYTCDECRYELGIVKVSASIIKRGEGDIGLVETAPADMRAIELTATATGEIRLNENATVHIAPRIAGVIARVNVDVGSRVNQGDVLFEIDSVELGEALGAYLKSRSLTALSQRNYEREKTLKARQVSSDLDMTEAQMRYEEHRTDFEAAAHKLQVLGLSKAEVTDLAAAESPSLSGRLPFRAPSAGVIIARHATLGERVEPGADMLVLTDTSTVWALLDIYEQDLALLLDEQARSPLAVRIETRAFPGQVFTGRLDLIAATMEEATRTVKARVSVLNPAERLRPGMFCHAAMVLPATAEAVAVPRAAVLADEGCDFVFKHMEGDYYLRTPVKTGRSAGAFVEILDGIKAGDIVVTEGAFLLKSDVLREKMGAGCAD